MTKPTLRQSVGPVVKKTTLLRRRPDVPASVGAGVKKEALQKIRIVKGAEGFSSVHSWQLTRAPTLIDKFFGATSELVQNAGRLLGGVVEVPTKWVSKQLARTGWVWPKWLTTFRVAVLLSVSLHAWILTINFALPALKKYTSAPMQITAILVNTQTDTAPKNEKFIAQVNVDAGGTVDEDKTPTSALAKSAVASVGVKDGASSSLADLQRQQQEIQEQVNYMLSELSAQKVPEKKVEQAEPPSEAGKLQMDLAAKIEKDLATYAQRPKKYFVGVSAKESEVAAWVEGWQRKVEWIGNQYYPDAARGKVRGQLIITVGVSSKGFIESIKIDQSSGQKLLDEAATRILHLAAPFEVFDTSMSKKMDIIYITRLWRFGPEGITYQNAVSN